MARVRIPIPDDCCGVAREMVSHGLDPDTVLEFMRGEVVCLRGTARAFAKRTLRETAAEGPKHVAWKPRPKFWEAPGADADDSQSD